MNMGRLIYTNVFALNIHYPLVDYILNIKTYIGEDDELIVCFWDIDVYSFNIASKKGASQAAKFREVVKELSRLLSSLKIKHKFLYLTDSIKRINNKKNR